MRHFYPFRFILIHFADSVCRFHEGAADENDVYRWGVLLAGVTALAVAFVCVCVRVCPDGDTVGHQT